MGRMRLVRLGIVLVVLAGCGVAHAGVQPPDPNDECPPGSEMPIDPGPGHEGWECSCILTGEVIGQIDMRGVFVLYPPETTDGDCSTPPGNDPGIDEDDHRSAAAASPTPGAATFPTAPDVTPDPEVLRRTG